MPIQEGGEEEDLGAAIPELGELAALGTTTDATLPDVATNAKAVPDLGDLDAVLDPLDPSGAIAATQGLRVDSHGLSSIAALPKPSIDDLLHSPLSNEIAEVINTAKGVDIFKKADELALKYVVEVMLPTLGLSDRHKTTAEMVLKLTKFDKVLKSTLPTFLQLSELKHSIARDLITHAITRQERDGTAESTGLNKIETAELLLGKGLAASMSDWLIKFSDLKYHAIKTKTGRTKAGFTSMWHVVREDAVAGYHAVHLANLNPAEYRKVNDHLITMIDGLKRIRPEIEESGDTASLEALDSKIDLYTKWHAAHNHTDEEGITEVWEEVEKAFVAQKGRLVVFTPQEYEYSIFKDVIIPQYSLRFKLSDDTEHPVANGIKEKHAKLTTLVTTLLIERGFTNAAAIMGNLPLPMLAYFVYKSGSEIQMAIAGQNLPNTDHVRQKHGSLATTNAEVMLERIKEIIPKFRDIFGNDYDAELEALDTNDILVNVGVHEICHNIGDPNVFESEHRGGLEEWKATGGEWVLMHLDSSTTYAQLKSAFLAEVLSAIRYTERKDDPALKAYYKGWNYYTKTAQELGLINKDADGKFSLDLSKEKLQQYAATITQQWFELHATYQKAKEATNTEDMATLTTARSEHTELSLKVTGENPFTKKAREVCKETA